MTSIKGGTTYSVLISFLYGYESSDEDVAELTATITADSEAEAIDKAVKEHYGDTAWFDKDETDCAGIFGQIFSYSLHNKRDYSETGKVQVTVIEETY
jgi:hypothetical protein